MLHILKLLQMSQQGRIKFVHLVLQLLEGFRYIA